MFGSFARTQYEKELTDFITMREPELRPILSLLKASFDTLEQNRIHLSKDGERIAQFLTAQKS